MQKNDNIGSFDAILDQKYGKPGTVGREEFNRTMWTYYMGDMLLSARKRAKMTQSEVARRVGTNKTHISKIERGLIEPGIGIFCRIAEALGMRVEIVKPIL